MARAEYWGLTVEQAHAICAGHAGLPVETPALEILAVLDAKREARLEEQRRRHAQGGMQRHDWITPGAAYLTLSGSTPGHPAHDEPVPDLA